MSQKAMSQKAMRPAEVIRGIEKPEAEGSGRRVRT